MLLLDSRVVLHSIRTDVKLNELNANSVKVPAVRYFLSRFTVFFVARQMVKRRAICVCICYEHIDEEYEESLSTSSDLQCVLLLLHFIR